MEDTGIGMALDYVQNRLYQAFTQENPIAAGTGLGLSLTKSILDMLSGTIHVESKQSEGTRVVVNIPMQQSRKVEHQTAGARRKSEAGTEETPSTAGSTSTYVDLATRFQDLGVEERIACFHPEVASLSSKPRLTQQALDLYLSEWFNLPIRTWSPAEQGRSLVIVDDTDVDALIGTLKSNDIHIRPTLVVLSSDHARISKTMAAAGLSGHYELITKPFGPYRAGKALLSAVAHLESSDTHRTPTNAPPQEPQFHESSPKTAFVSSMTASLETSLHLDVCGNEASANARMALNSPQSTPSTALTQPNLEPGEFPFPRNSNYSPQSGPTESRTSSLATTPFSTEQTSAPAAETTHRSIEPPTLRPEISHSQTERPATTNVDRPTRILLVDDNAINLRLITTYMKKLHYTHLDTASDGSIARDLFRTAIESSEPHDVVWMDLSMPIMDGFEATKAIRDLELEHAQGLSPIQKPSPAMIIALTGLASEKDQARAFEAGVDLYVTKPASFKEVGRMMKSWEKNGGVRASDALPHGPVTGATAASPEEMQKST